MAEISLELLQALRRAGRISLDEFSKLSGGVKAGELFNEVPKEGLGKIDVVGGRTPMPTQKTLSLDEMRANAQRTPVDAEEGPAYDYNKPAKASIWKDNVYLPNADHISISDLDTVKNPRNELGLNGLEEVPPPGPDQDRQIMRQQWLNRYGNDAPKAKRWLQKAAQSGQPYKTVEGASMGMPNFEFKVTQPNQVIGVPEIQAGSTSNPNLNHDPVPWMDYTYKILKNALLDAKEKGLPVNLHTSSDLIARPDYLEALPEGSTVNLQMVPRGKDQLNRILFPANPSRLRMELAAQKLKDAGVNVNVVEPTKESLTKLFNSPGYNDILERSGFTDKDNLIDNMVDPYSDKTLKPVNGIAPIAGAGLASQFQNPLSMLGDVSQKYNQAKEDFYRPLANQLDFTQDKSLAPGFTKALSAVADPINAIEGPLGATAQVTQAVGEANAPTTTPNGYATGGKVISQDDFVPDNLFVPDQSPASAANSGFIPDSQFQPDDSGSLGEQLKTVIEGVPGADLLAGKMRQAAQALGVNPDIIAPTQSQIDTRRQENPVSAVVGGALGAAPIIGGIGGVAAGLAGTEAGAGLSGALQATTGLGMAGSHVAAGAIEGAMLGAGSAVSDAALGDPDLNAQKVASQIGIGALLGVGAGLLGAGVNKVIGKFGAPKGSVSDVVQNEIETTNNSAKTASAIEKLDDATGGVPAPEVLDIAKRQNLPVLEGMATDNPWIKKAEDSLINGAPTYSGIKRAALYSDAFNKVIEKMSEIVPDETSTPLTKATVGDALQGSLVNKIDEGGAAAGELYDTIKQTTKDIPLSDRSAPAIARNILDMQEVRISPRSPEAQLATRVADEVANLQTVDDVKSYRAVLNRSVSPTASAGEKRMLAILSDKLKSLEDNSIDRYVTKQNEIHAGLEGDQKAAFQPYIDRINALTEQKAQANAMYKPFIEKVKNLAEQLGKRRVSGPQDAINFIKDLTPESVTQKLFSKNNSQFLQFFEKNFPEEMALMRQYQKQVLRESATKDGIFSPKTFFTKLNKLEPEIQKAIFHPDELARLKDYESYLNRFPKNFNPSGTSGMNAFREFFNSPTGFLISNARDFGIESFIKTMGALPDNLKPNPFSVGSELAQKFNRLNAIRQLAEKADLQIAGGVRGIFIGGSSAASEGPRLISHSYDDRVKRIEELAQNSDALENHLSSHVDGITDHLPNVAQSSVNTINTATQFLNSKIPRPANKFALSTEYEPSEAQKEKFDQYYDAVNDPIGVLDNIRDGTLNNDQLESLAIVHPALFKHMQAQVEKQLSIEKAKTLPHYVKSSLSMFLGKPIDESTFQPVMQYNQLTLQKAEAERSQFGKTTRPTLGGLQKLKVSDRAATGVEKLESAKD